MSDSVLVAKVDCRDHLFEVKATQVLVEAAGLSDDVEQLSTSGQFDGNVIHQFASLRLNVLLLAVVDQVYDVAVRGEHFQSVNFGEYCL